MPWRGKTFVENTIKEFPAPDGAAPFSIVAKVQLFQSLKVDAVDFYRGVTPPE